MKKDRLKKTVYFMAFVAIFLSTSSYVTAQNKVVVIPLDSSSQSCQSCPPEVVVTKSDSIQNAIDNLPVDGGYIFIKSGVHEIDSGIHINRPNVTISGEQGAIIKLKSGVNQPVFLVGTDIASPTLANLITNISISNLKIDGNQAGQSSETDPTRPHIRNNGIDIRTVSDLWINTIEIHDARSGGIVASWKSSNIFISKVNTYDNYYDGIALYDSTNIVVTDFISNNNDHGAGLSLDNELKNVIFSSGFIQGNSDVGIFARNSENMLFSNVIVSDNGNHGAFLSHDSSSPSNTGIKSILFTGCSFQDNSGYGIQFASPATYSNKNAVTGTLFNGNTAGCLIYEAGSATEGSNVCL
jgi:hypothetical protein